MGWIIVAVVVGLVLVAAIVRLVVRSHASKRPDLDAVLEATAQQRQGAQEPPTAETRRSAVPIEELGMHWSPETATARAEPPPLFDGMNAMIDDIYTVYCDKRYSDVNRVARAEKAKADLVQRQVPLEAFLQNFQARTGDRSVTEALAHLWKS